MISGDVLKSRPTRVAAGVLAVVLAATACGRGSEVVATKDPTATTTQEKQFTPIIGSVAHTENAAGVKEGVFATHGAGESAGDRKNVRLVLDGATVQVLCHAVGREIDLRIQSPGLGIERTKDWLQLNDTGHGREWVPDVFVDTPADQPVPEC